MSLSEKDQFYHVITSDAEPDNKSSNFKVLLSNPINVSEGDWEVCLKYISYSFSWATIGKAANVYMKFFTPRTKMVEINFPNMHCESIKHVVHQIREQIPLDSDGNPIIQVKVDDIDRFRIICHEPFFDIGFSSNMLRMLGLLNHEYSDYFHIDNFEKRQKYRDVIEDFLHGKFSYDDTALIKELEKIRVLSDFIKRMRPKLDIRYLFLNYETLYEKYVRNAETQEELGVKIEVIEEEGEVHNNARFSHIGDKERQLLFLLMFSMKRVLFKFTYLPIITSKTPGEINQVQRMFIYLNILDDINMNDSTSRILKIINTRGSAFKLTQEEFINPIYLPVKRGRHDLLQVYIKNDQGDNVPFQSGTVLMILHFRRKTSW